jgi:hypothetical protein
MPTLGNTPRPAYVYDTETDTWVPVGVGAHTHDTLYVNQNVIDAKGDLLAGTADNSYGRVPVGANGTVLVSDPSTSTGLAWQPYAAPFVAGKNKIINGDFSVWQRGTSFTGTAYDQAVADRFFTTANSVGSLTTSRQSFAVGTAPVAGYESQYFLRYSLSQTGSGGISNQVYTKIEDVRHFAGQTVTFSFWAKSSSSYFASFFLDRWYGSGGSAIDYNAGMGSGLNITTEWQRFSVTVTVPAITGKTIGTSSFLRIGITLPAYVTATVDTWGWQLEAGSIATPFTTSTGTLQGELAACQRYYWRFGGENVFENFGVGMSGTSSFSVIYVQNPVPMRIAPTSIEYANLQLTDNYAYDTPVSNVVFGGGSKNRMASRLDN